MYTVDPQTVVITACLSLLMCKGTAVIWMTHSSYGPSLIQSAMFYHQILMPHVEKKPQQSNNQEMNMTAMPCLHLTLLIQ